MKAEAFKGFTRYLGKPPDWKPQVNGRCRELAIRDGEDVPGVHTMSSIWVLTDEERKLIADGSNIELIVCGYVHPAVALVVTDAEIL